MELGNNYSGCEISKKYIGLWLYPFAIEIIVVDDLSTDNSRNILLEYKNHSNLKVIFNSRSHNYSTTNTIKKIIKSWQ